MRLSRVGADAAPALSEAHGRSFARGWAAQDIAALIELTGGFCFAAFDAGRVTGLVIGRVTAGEAEILTLAVDPELRGAGLGRALVDAAVETARVGGAEDMYLEVAADNAPAISLYARTGFETVGVRAGYYSRAEGSVDALVMRRALNTAAG